MLMNTAIPLINHFGKDESGSSLGHDFTKETGKWLN